MQGGKIFSVRKRLFDVLDIGVSGLSAEQYCIGEVPGPVGVQPQGNFSPKSALSLMTASASFRYASRPTLIFKVLNPRSDSRWLAEATTLAYQ